ncbi:MAG TPA: hypothetical protein VGM17_14645 [Rhizomicrobium sp.]|jgi:hypothetical protein
MILVDTSVWADHLRFGVPRFQALLDGGEVLCHPFIIGEVALGFLKRRDKILGSMQSLPRVVLAGNAEALDFINRNALFGSGIGYVDVHLLVSTRLTPGAMLWAKDKKLAAAAHKFGVGATV